MTIAIDYDDTFTKAPELWNKFVEAATALGIDVIIVTMRNTEQIGDLHQVAHSVPRDKVFFTALQGKRKFMKDNHGRHIDIWIDDSPEFVCVDHPSLFKEQLRWADVSKFNSGPWRKE